MGISSHSAGQLTFPMAAFIGALSGLLIGPTTTVFYDSGFLIGLKGFVAAVIAGLSSYPGALLGALFVGIVEAFGAFWASAFKEVIVFTIILPVLLVRSLRAGTPTRTIDMKIKNFALLVLAIAIPVAGLAARARFLDHAAQLHRLVCAGVPGPGAAHRRRRTDLLRPGGLCRHWCLHDGLADTEHWHVALADPVCRSGHHRRQRVDRGWPSRCACRATTCRWPPSPGACRSTT